MLKNLTFLPTCKIAQNRQNYANYADFASSTEPSDAILKITVKAVKFQWPTPPPSPPPHQDGESSDGTTYQNFA